MKYSIDGISKEKTIRSVELVKKGKENKKSQSKTDVIIEIPESKVIMVNYLDGTQDIFDFNAETLKRIENIMTSQAKEYVEKNSKNLLLNPTLRLIFIVGAIVAAGLVIGVELPTFTTALIGSTSIILGAAAISGTVKAQDVKKYNLFLKKVSGKLNEYIEILKKENELVARKEQKTAKITGIRELDKTSVKTLNKIVTKVDRYQEIDGKGQKTKTL